MMTKIVLPMVAVAGLGFAIYTVVQARQAPPPSPSFQAPPTRPEGPRSIAGAGLVEAKRENIPIGTQVPGVVAELYVKIHDHVKAGQPLFRIDDRDLQAQRLVRQANLKASEAQLDRLKAAPQLQDVPTAEAAVTEARSRLNDAEVVLGRTAELYERKVVPASDYDRDRYAYNTAAAVLARTKAELERIRTTWAKDIAVAESAVEQSKALLASIEVDLDRLTVRAMADGQILQVNVRPGQFAAMIWNEPLMVLGDVTDLHVRVDIDEQDLPMFQVGSEAVATLKGRPSVRFPLTFVKVEPFVVPKRSLTGDNAERVDTRVLQVIYALPTADQRPIPVFVGQQMDVYLRAGEVSEGLELDTDAPRPFDDAPSPKAAPGPVAAVPSTAPAPAEASK